MRVVRSGVYHIHFGSGASRSRFYSQTYISLGGGESVTGCILALLALQGQVHSTLCTRMLIWSRALAIARAVS